MRAKPNKDQRKERNRNIKDVNHGTNFRYGGFGVYSMVAAATAMGFVSQYYLLVP